MDRWDQAVKKLTLLCTELELRGYTECLYLEGGKKVKRCLDNPDGFWCQVCPSIYPYWEKKIMGKYGRAKGVRGERELTRRLCGKRVGVAYLKNPVDLEIWNGKGVVQVKNCSLGGTAICDAIELMERTVDENLCKFVIFKPRRGKWLVCQTLDQWEELHGKLPNA